MKPAEEDHPNNNNDDHENCSSSLSSCFSSISSTITPKLLLSLTSKAILIIFIWLVLWLLFPNDAYHANTLFNPGGVLFDPLVIFLVTSIVGKSIGNVLGVPPLILIFFLGLAWGNIPEYDFLSSGISKETRRVTARIGLANILLRTGLSISPKTIGKAKWNILLMSLLPLLTEVLVHGFVAGALYDDYKNSSSSSLWPFLQAAIVAPSASGVVAAVVMIIQQKGYTVTRGPGVLLTPACGLDMSIGIWFVNFVASLIFRDEGDSLAWSVIQGPLQIVVGGIVGFVLGLIWYYVGLRMLVLEFVDDGDADEKEKEKEQEENDSNTNKKLNSNQLSEISHWATYLLGLFAAFSIFFGYFIESAGGGCVACTMCGFTVSGLLTQENKDEEQEQEIKTKQHANAVEDKEMTTSTPAVQVLPLSPPDEHQHHHEDDEENKKKKDEETSSSSSSFNTILSSISLQDQLTIKSTLVKNFAALWDDLVMPCLFSFSASSLDLVAMFDPSTVGLAIATIFIGVICRYVVTLGCSFSYENMTRSEWVIGAFCLGGKAFTQVALAGIGNQIVSEQIGTTFNSTQLLDSSAASQVAELKRLGKHVSDAGALSVMFVSPIVVVLLSVVGPKFFWYTDEEMKKRGDNDDGVEN